MVRSLTRRLPHIGRLPRLCAAGICLLLALGSALGAKHAVAAPRRAVVVAAHDLPAGHVLVPGDVRIARWPAALVPPGARASPAALGGQRLATPVRAREVVTDGRLLGRGLTAGLRPGTVAAAVPLDDPHAAELVHAGDRVDVLTSPRPADVADARAPANAPVRTLATEVLVLAIFPDGDAANGAGAEIVLAVDRATAVAITRDSAGHVFTVVADPP